MTVTVHERLPNGRAILRIERRGTVSYVKVMLFDRRLSYAYRAQGESRD